MVGLRAERFTAYCSKDKLKAHHRVIVDRARKMVFGEKNERKKEGMVDLVFGLPEFTDAFYALRFLLTILKYLSSFHLD